MNSPFALPQGSASQPVAAKTRVITITKPANGQSYTVNLSHDGSVKLDFSQIANEKITIVKVPSTIPGAGEKAIILFDNQSTITIDPFFFSGHWPVQLSIDTGSQHDLTVSQFASIFPVTEDKSVLPAGGEQAEQSGMTFEGPNVDPLGPSNPLALLPPEELPNWTATTLLAPQLNGTENDLIPGQGTPVSGVVEEEHLVLGAHNSPVQLSQGNEDATGNPLDLDTADPPNFDNTTNVANGSLAGLVVGGDLPIHFSLANPGSDTVAVIADGQALKSQGSPVLYHWIDANHVIGYVDSDSSTTFNGAVNHDPADNNSGPDRIVFELTVNDDGTFKFELFDQVDHAAGSGENLLGIDFTSLLQIVDNNGTELVLNGEAFTIQVIDDVPVVSSEIALAKTLEEDDLNNFDKGDSNNDHIEGSEGNDSTKESTSTVFNLNSLYGNGDVKIGSDEFSFKTINDREVGVGLFGFVDISDPAAVLASIQSVTATDGVNTQTISLTSKGQAVDGVSESGDTLTFTAGGRIVFTLELDSSTGELTFTLIDQLDHPYTDDPTTQPVETEFKDSLILDLSGLVQVADFDGDPATLAPNTLQLTIADDIPEFASLDGSSAPFEVSLGAASSDAGVTGHFDVMIGADEPGTFDIHPEGSQLQLPGFDFTTTTDPNTGIITLVATLNDDPFYTLTVDPTDPTNGSYNFHFDGSFSQLSTTTFTTSDIVSISPGAPQETITSALDVAGNPTGSISFDGVFFDSGGGFGFTDPVDNTDKLHPSAQGFGVGDNNMDDNEGFVATLNGTTADKFSFDINFTGNGVNFADVSWEVLKDGNVVGTGSGHVLNPNDNSNVPFTIDPNVEFDQIYVRFDFDGAGGSEQAKILNFTADVATVTTPSEADFNFQLCAADKDTDEVCADFTISVTNSTPTVNVPTEGAATEVSELGLPLHDALPAGSGEIADNDAGNNNDSSEMTSGTIAFTAGDGLDSIKIGTTTITLAELQDSSTTPINVVGNFGTLTIDGFTFDSGTGAGTVHYEYTLEHNTSGDSTHDDFAVVVKDTDGQTANDIFKVFITDDTPAAHDDTLQSVAEDAAGTIGGNVLTNDTPGADGATLTDVNLGTGFVAITTGTDLGGGVFQFTNAHGIYTFKSDGTWTFDPATNQDNTAGSVDASFTYQITDGDTDTSTAIQPIKITDGAGPSAGEPVTLEVNEAALLTAGATGSDPSLTTETDNSPTLSFTAGSDNLVSFKFSTDLTGLVTDLDGAGGDDIFWVRESDTQIKGFLDAAHTELAVTLDLSGPASIAAGASDNVTVTMTLDDNLLHPDDLGAQLSSIGQVDVVASDIDGNSTSGTVNLDVKDDIPSATDEASQDVAEGATVTGVLDFVAGADGATVTHINGTLLTFDPLDSNYSQPIDIGAGTIKVKADGSYSFTADASVDNSGGSIPVSATFKVTDGDGDTDTADISFAITDANTPESGIAAAAVDDDGLTGGNPASTTFDLDANALDDAGDTSEATFTGILGGSVGGDGAGANGFSLAGMDLAAGTVGTEAVIYHWDGVDTLTATINGGARNGLDLFEVQITDAATGAYHVTLLDNVIHATGPNDENAVDPTASLTYTITDADNSFTTGTLTITFDDDAPTATSDTGNVNEGALLTVLASGVLSNDAAGADGAMIDGVRAAGGDTTTAVSGGVDTDIAGLHGTLHLKADGSYTYQSTADGITSDTTDVFVYTLKDGDGDLSTTTLTINLANATVLAPDDSDVTVNEAGLDTTTTPPDLAHGTITGSLGTGSASETDATNQLNGSGGFGTLTYALVTGGNAATAGTFGTIQVNTDGTYTYTLTTNYLNPTADDGVQTLNGVESFQYKVTDANGNSEIGTIKINIVDDVPTANDDTYDPTITEATTISGLLGNDVFGADGVDTDNSPVPGQVTVTDGAHGTVTYNDDGTFTYTPTGVFVGDDTFTYTITDGDGDTDPATVTVHVDTNTVPTGGGSASLLVNEAALDTTQDASPAPADLAAGVVTGTNPSSRAETDQKTTGITFTATGETITVAFGDPAVSGSGWVAPTVNGLDAGYHLEWRLSSGQLIGNLVKDAGSLNLGDAIILSLTNTTATPGNSVTPTVTVTLIDNLQHVAGLGTNDVTIDGLQVVATDVSGDQVSGSVDVTVRDDVPLAFTTEPVFVEDVTQAAALTGQINFTSKAGADGVGDVIFNTTTGNITEGGAVKDSNGNNLFMNGEQLFYHIVDSHTVQAKSSALNGSDLAFTAVLHPGTDTWDFTLNGTIFNGAAFNTTTFINPGGANDAAIVLNSPGSPNDLLVTANGANKVNTNANEWGVDQGNSITNGETIRFDLVTNASTDGTIAGSSYTGHYEVGSYTQKVTGLSTSQDATFTIRAVNADNDLVFVGDGSGESTATPITVTVVNAGGSLTPIVTVNGDGTVTLSNIENNDTFTIISNADPFSAVEITGLTGTDTFKLVSPSFTTANAVNPFDVVLPVTATDGDSDLQSGSLTVKLSPDASTTQGTSGDDSSLQTTATIKTLLGEDGNDTLTGLNGQVDTLAGGRGNDTLIGKGSADNLWGGSGADTFRYLAASDGTDHIGDFNTAEGDIVEILASAFGGGLTAGTDATGIFGTSGDANFSSPTERFHYDTTNHTLYYDADGSNGGFASQALATFDNNATIQAQNIHMV